MLGNAIQVRTVLQMILPQLVDAYAEAARSHFDAQSCWIILAAGIHQLTALCSNQNQNIDLWIWAAVLLVAASDLLRSHARSLCLTHHRANWLTQASAVRVRSFAVLGYPTLDFRPDPNSSSLGPSFTDCLSDTLEVSLRSRLPKLLH